MSMILNKTNEPMVNNSNHVQTGEVYFTNDLKRFVTMNGNRVVNPKHVDRIAESQKRNGVLMNPIIVNSLWEVVDGQHRLEASKRNGLGIYYIIAPNYTLSEVHALNLNQKNWGTIDYLNGYADMGIPPYVGLRDFMLNNQCFPISNAIAICSTSLGGDGGHHNKPFNNGEWLNRDWRQAQDYSDKIQLVGTIYDGYTRRTFVCAMMALFANKNFDFNEFMSKLRMQPSALVDCVRVSDYKILIEDIYNYRRRNKISLKY